MFRIHQQVPIEDLISRQITFWDSKHKQSPQQAIPALPNICISRDPGSRGNELAMRLGKRLNWKIFDKEIVDYIANNANVRRELVELFDEKKQSEMNRLIASLMNRHAMTHEAYFKYLAKTILSIGQHGAAIILGRGAYLILPDSIALKVYLMESLEDRINNLLKMSMTRKEAEDFIKKAKNEREAFLNRFFGRKSMDLQNYELVINLSRLSLDNAEKILLHALQAKFDLSEKELKLSEKSL